MTDLELAELLTTASTEMRTTAGAYQQKLHEHHQAVEAALDRLLRKVTK